MKKGDIYQKRYGDWVRVVVRDPEDGYVTYIDPGDKAFDPTKRTVKKSTLSSWGKKLPKKADEEFIDTLMERVERNLRVFFWEYTQNKESLSPDLQQKIEESIKEYMEK